MLAFVALASSCVSYVWSQKVQLYQVKEAK